MTRRARLIAVTGALLPAVALAACGSSSSDDKGGGTADKPTSLAIKVSGSGKDATFSMPKSAKAGVTRIEVTNDAKAKHATQFVRIDSGHTPDEASKAASAWGDKGKPLPAWIHLGGGVPTVAPGATGTSTQVLAPGKYFVVDLEADNTSGVEATFEVTGKPPKGAGLEAPTAQINAIEYTFKSAGLKAGPSPVLIQNQGKEPHFIAAARIKPGKTIADVKQAIKSEKGPPPVEEASSVTTPVQDGKGKQVVELNLKKGKYALLCFVPDRKGGPPHAFKGMVAQAVVR
jgi:hypothetical protein